MLLRFVVVSAVAVVDRDRVTAPAAFQQRPDSVFPRLLALASTDGCNCDVTPSGTIAML